MNAWNKCVNKWTAEVEIPGGGGGGGGCASEVLQICTTTILYYSIFWSKRVLVLFYCKTLRL